MRRYRRKGLLFAAFALALGAGCGDSGWTPVAGKDARAYAMTAPTLYRDETHTVVLKVFGNGTETIPAGLEMTLEVFEDPEQTVPYCAPITVTHPTDLATRDLVNVEFALPVDLATPVDTTLYLVATIDLLNNVEEAIETNNVLELSRVVGPERRASLSPVEPFAPEVFRDETNAVMLGVRNDGDKAAPAGFELTLEVYEDASHLTEFCPPIVVACPEDILPGQTLAVEFPLPVDISVAVGTDLYLVATIDSLDAIEEWDETDNVVEAAVQVQLERMPDLIVDEILFPDYIRRGYGYTMAVTIRNDDNEVATAPFTVTITEPTASWSDTWTVDADLAPGAEITFTTSYSVAEDASLGDLTFTATVDTTAAVVERDEGNNSLAEVSQVSTLDLKIDYVSGPLSVAANVPYDYEFRVTNSGTMPTPGSWVDIYRCHVVFDFPIIYADFNDIRQTWPSVAVPIMQPGDSVLLTASLASTVNSYSGICIVFEVDPDNTILEESETNNRDSRMYF